MIFNSAGCHGNARRITSYAYKLIRRLNAELEADGFVTIKGRVSTQYFMKRIYGLSTDKEVR